VDKIARIMQSREEKKLRSIDVLDICNIIASIVVAGNVRRSATIALGDPDDYLYLRAKNWTLGNIPNWRGMSNNTIYADAFDHISEEVWGNGYYLDPKTGRAKGEPYGFFNLPLSQRYGRLKDGLMKDSDLYPADKDNCSGTNPCGEISLASGESCNLSELYLNNIRSKDELIDCASLLYKTQKAVAAMPFLHEETNVIVHKNMRLGLGVTGVCQSLDKLAWLDDCYLALRALDKQWSKLRGWPESIKLTTVKPSGSLSLLAGATPGIHPAYSPYYIRRVRMSSEDKLVKVCRDAGYVVEFQKRFDGTDDHSTMVVEFPCKTPEGALFAGDMGVIQQLDLVKQLQTVWSDNAVSVTAYYTPEEMSALKEWMGANYAEGVKSVSFLLKDLHGFLQAPYETITEERYKELVSKVKPLQNLGAAAGGGTLDSLECAGGVCPIR
jgi:ribonucleoside-triphosphate reductase